MVELIPSSRPPSRRCADLVPWGTQSEKRFPMHLCRSTVVSPSAQESGVSVGTPHSRHKAAPRLPRTPFEGAQSIDLTIRLRDLDSPGSIGTVYVEIAVTLADGGQAGLGQTLPIF